MNMSLGTVQSAAQLAAMGGTLVENYDQASQVFNRLIMSSMDLSSPSKDTVLKACRIIYLDISSLIVYTESRTQSVELRTKRIAEELLSTDGRYNDVHQRLKRANQKVSYLAEHLEQLKAQRYRLKRSIQETENEIKELQAHLEEEKRHRANMFLDHTVPFYAMIDGLIKGEPQRMLPGYSLGRGVGSFICTDVGELEKSIEVKRNEQGDLERERDSTREKINTERADLRGLESEIERLDHAKVTLTWETQRYGRQLTALREVQIALKNMLTKYHMLQGDLNTIQSFIDDHHIRHSLCDSFKEEVRSCVSRFRAIEMT